MDNIQNIAKLISIGMTFPTVILAAVVVYTWLPSAINSLKTSSLESQEWFIIGVIVGFIGAIFDNIFWVIPWTYSFIGVDLYYKVIPYGILFNIIFRQLCIIIAAYCHLKAAEMTFEPKIKYLNNILVCGNIAGLIYSISLILIKLF